MTIRYAERLKDGEERNGDLRVERHTRGATWRIIDHNGNRRTVIQYITDRLAAGARELHLMDGGGLIGGIFGISGQRRAWVDEQAAFNVIRPKGDDE